MQTTTAGLQYRELERAQNGADLVVQNRPRHWERLHVRASADSLVHWRGGNENGPSKPPSRSSTRSMPGMFIHSA